MNSTNHILVGEGVLISFSIARKLSHNDVKNLKEKIKNKNLSTEQIHSHLIEETKKIVNSKKIPGLTEKESVIELNDEKKRIRELTYFSSLISKKIIEKNLNKYYMCYVINTLINLLKLNDEDFEDFYDKFSDEDDGGLDEVT